MKDFVFVSGDNQIVCSTSKGQLLSFEIQHNRIDSTLQNQQVKVRFHSHNIYELN
jgi:hypothetical protein